MKYLTGHIDQLLGIHIVKDSLSVLAVSAAFHDGQEKLRGVIFQLQDKIHS